MKVFTHRPLPSARIEMSTGSGVLAGSPIAPTSLACHWPLASFFTSHRREVSAVAVIAQSSFGASDQRISSGAPGTLSTCSGRIAFRFQTTIVLPNCFIAAPSFISVPRGIM